MRLYLIVVLLFGAGILFSLYGGGRLATGVPAFAADRPATAAVSSPAAGLHPAARHDASSIFSGIDENANSPLSRLLVQIAVIVGASWGVGWLFRFCGQPAVLGEMTAGILLGPSLFGWLAPHAFQFVFAPESLGALRLFSQIGVCFFMFAVGMELDLSELRQSAHRSLVIGHSSIVIPYFLGVLIAVPLYRLYAQPGAAFAPFALMMGISMSHHRLPGARAHPAGSRPVQNEAGRNRYPVRGRR